MTLEQPALQITSQSQAQRYAKVREVTGAPDHVIEEAIRACSASDGSYKVEDVVTTIIADDSLNQHGKSKQSTNQSPRIVDQVDAVSGDSNKIVGDSTQKKTLPVSSKTVSLPATEEFIDLTRDQQGILGGQVSREEQDISRVLEASLAETKSCSKRKRGELWFTDPLNPHNRKREPGWPVGLKNVGNTCWFSAVIQSLFHIPKFREIIVNYKQSDFSSTNQIAANFKFVSELRHLFGLLLSSKRKYVDPSKAVDILKDSSSSSALDGQQDVSEFQHKLLDWLEDAFKVPTTENNEETKKKENPVNHLFKGKYKAEGIHEGKVFCQEETFGQYPLNVVGFADIHQSLEASTAQDDIETISGDVNTKSGQEIWFTHLPVVLTFGLSRFGFNQQLNRVEKIHQPLNFPSVLYVDRYLECNKSATRQKREEARKLTDELKTLQAKLDNLMNYGSGAKRIPLPDVLKYALEFAQSGPSHQPHRDTAPQPQDVDMDSSMSCPRGWQACSTHNTQSAVSSSAPEAKKFKDSSVQASFNTSASSDVSMTSTPTPPATPALHTSTPRPKSVSDEEMRVLEACLTRWRHDVEADVKELQRNISTLKEKLEGMYSDTSMKKFPYHLHSVLVHEGQAGSGHFWSFIYDQGRSTWLKFNDITVSESTEEEMGRESRGGFHNGSAYCLMYVDRSRLEHGQGDGPTNSSTAYDLLSSLPCDLRAAVEADNSAFDQEVITWEQEQRSKATSTQTPQQCSESSTVPVFSSTSPPTQITSRRISEEKIRQRSRSGDQDVIITGENRPAGKLSTFLSQHHAQLSLQASLAAVTSASQTETSPQSVAIKALEKEISRLNHISKGVGSRLPEEDPRLDHVVLYLMCSRAPAEVIEVVISEQLSLCDKVDTVSQVRGVRKKAQKLCTSFYKNLSEENLKHYHYWHKKFHHFRQATFLFSVGVEAYCAERYHEALPYFNQAWLHNLEPDAKQTNGRLDIKMLAFLRRSCLLRLNDTTIKMFEEDTEMTDALTTMVNLILPGLAHLSISGLPEDTETVEEIKNKWCHCLELDLSEAKKTKLQDLLSKMFESSTGVVTSLSERVQSVRVAELMVTLAERYRKAMRGLKARGLFGAWLNS